MPAGEAPDAKEGDKKARADAWVAGRAYSTAASNASDGARLRQESLPKCPGCR